MLRVFRTNFRTHLL